MLVAENKKSSVLLKFLSVEIDSNAVLNLCKKGKVISEISCFCKYGYEFRLLIILLLDFP